MKPVGGIKKNFVPAICLWLSVLVLLISFCPKVKLIVKSPIRVSDNFVIIVLKNMAANVSICVRAGLPKLRLIPDTERTKDTKTLDYASTPLDANTLLATVGSPSVLFYWSKMYLTF